MVQERARRGRDHDLLEQAHPHAGHVELFQRAHGRLCLALGGAERREIVVAEEPLRRPMHQLGIERPGHLPDMGAGERGGAAPVEDAVAVVPPDRRVPRVELLCHHLGGKDGDGLRPQMRVQRVAHGVGAPILRKVEMGDLMDCVHAGIGATGAGEPRRLAGEARHGGLDGGLHGRVVGLTLPAAERRAVVLDDELVAGHQACALTRAAPLPPTGRRARTPRRWRCRPCRPGAVRGVAPHPCRRQPCRRHRAACPARRSPRR